MARRVSLAPTTTNADGVTVPNTNATAYVVLGQRGQWMLLKYPDDGSALSATDIGVLPDTETVTDSQGQQIQVRATRIRADALTTTQQQAFKTWLANHGIDVSQFTVTDRRLLHSFVRAAFGLVPGILVRDEINDGVMVQ